MQIFKMVKIAFLNILRNSRRSIITFLAMSVGSATLICLGGFMEYSFEGLRETTIRTQLGHFQIYHTGYVENETRDPYQYLIKDYAKISADLFEIAQIFFEYSLELSHIETITQRLTFSGLISKDNMTFSALFVGVNAQIEEEGFSAFETIIAGRQIKEEDDYGAVIGSELAKALNLKIGDGVSVLTTTVDGMMNAIDLEVIGIARTGSKDYDKVFVKIPLNLMQKVLNTSGVEKILVLLNDTDSMTIVEKIIKDYLEKSENKGKYEYRTWEELAEYYQGVKNIYTGFFNLFEVSILIIVFFSIYNTLSMSIFERTKEIGTLRAIGFYRIDILKMFMLEGFILGIIGSGLGVILGIIIASAINISGGIYIAPPPGQSVGYTAEILLVPFIMVKSSILIIIISVISSIYPSISGARRNIVRALGYV